MLVFVIATGSFVVLRFGSNEMAQVSVLSALLVLIVAAGISALRRRAYWWALLATISMAVVGTANAVWAWQQTYLTPCDSDTAARVLLAVRGLAFWGIPGLLALILLANRNGGFGVERARTAPEGGYGDQTGAELRSGRRDEQA